MRWTDMALSMIPLVPVRMAETGELTLVVRVGSDLQLRVVGILEAWVKRRVLKKAWCLRQRRQRREDGECVSVPRQEREVLGVGQHMWRDRRDGAVAKLVVATCGIEGLAAVKGLRVVLWEWVRIGRGERWEVAAIGAGRKQLQERKV